MGINGLLPALKPIAKQVHVSKYQGKTVAVDGYSWLHKGAYCCARELCEGIWTDKFVSYFISRIQLLRSNGVDPVVVFDGGRLPIKGEEEHTRHRARAEARERAAAHLAAGNLAAAVDCYQRCVDITPAMAKCVIEALRAINVRFIVAPYEADAQIAYLARNGAVHAVITEDSDLLAYGCPRVLYKLDRSGSGEELCTADLSNCPGLPLSSFTSDQFLQLCVMAGCDFLQQLPGIGLKKAHGVLRKYRCFKKVVRMLRFGGTRVPADYEIRFQMALWAFRHCRVYCPEAQAVVHLSPLPAGGLGSADVTVLEAVQQLEQQQQLVTLDFLGPFLPADVAKGIAQGELDPNTHQPFDLAKVYAGCPNPPAHVAAQLLPVMHLLELKGSAQGSAAHRGDVGGLRSGGNPVASAAPAAASGSSRPRVGLSKRHSGRATAAGGAGVEHASRRPSAAAVAAGSKKLPQKSTLGIAKYFTLNASGKENDAKVTVAAPAAAGTGSAYLAVPAVATGASTGSAAGACVTGAAGPNAGAAPTAAAADAAAASNTPAAVRLQRSIAAALQTLQQQQEFRQQQELQDKQQFIAELQQQDQLQQQQEQQRQTCMLEEQACFVGICDLQSPAGDDGGDAALQRMTKRRRPNLDANLQEFNCLTSSSSSMPEILSNNQHQSQQQQQVWRQQQGYPAMHGFADANMVALDEVDQLLLQERLADEAAAAAAVAGTGLAWAEAQPQWGIEPAPAAMADLASAFAVAGRGGGGGRGNQCSTSVVGNLGTYFNELQSPVAAFGGDAVEGSSGGSQLHGISNDGLSLSRSSSLQLKQAGKQEMTCQQQSSQLWPPLASGSATEVSEECKGAAMSALDSLFVGPAQPALPALSQAAALAADEEGFCRPALGSPPCIEKRARGMFAVQQQMRQPSCPMTSSFFTKGHSSSGYLSACLPQEDWHGANGSRVLQKTSSQGLSGGDLAAASQPTAASPSAGLRGLCSSRPSRIKVAEAIEDQEVAELPPHGSAFTLGRGLGGHQEGESNSSAWQRLRLSLRQGGSVHHTSRLQCETEVAAPIGDYEGRPTGTDNLLVEAGVAQTSWQQMVRQDVVDTFGKFRAQPHGRCQLQQQQQHTACGPPAEVAGGTAAAGTSGGGQAVASEPTSGSSNSSGSDSMGEDTSQPDISFNSIRHVNGFAKLAARTVRRAHKRQRQVPQQAAAPVPAAGFTMFACQVSTAGVPTPTRAATDGLQLTQQQHLPLQRMDTTLKAGAAVPGLSAAAAIQDDHCQRPQRQRHREDLEGSGPEFEDKFQMRLTCTGAAAATATSQPFKTPWLSDCRQGALGDAPGQLTEAAAARSVDSRDLALPHLPSMSLSPAGSDVAVDDPTCPARGPSGMLQQQLHMHRGEASCGMFGMFRCKSTTPAMRSSGERDTGQLLQSRGTAAEGVVDVFGMMNRQQLQHRRPGLARLSSSRGTCR